jgi:hypothetical protein
VKLQSENAIFYFFISPLPRGKIIPTCLKVKWLIFTFDLKLQTKIDPTLIWPEADLDEFSFNLTYWSSDRHLALAKSGKIGRLGRRTF